MTYKSVYAIPLNLKIFKKNYDFYNGIGKLTKEECVDRSLLISGVQVVDLEDFEEYIETHQLENIFL